MPTNVYQDDEENNRSNGGSSWNNSGTSGGQPSSSVTTTAPAGGGITPSTPGSAGTQPSASTSSGPIPTQNNQGGSGFVNISNLLQLNKDQGNKLGQGLASDAEAKAQQAQNDARQAYSGFQGQVNAQPGAVDWNQYYRGGEPAYASVNDTNYADVQNQLNQLGNISQRTYQGPTDFTAQPGYGNLQSEIQSAQDAINGIGSQSLTKLGDTAAQSQFDQMFVGGNPAIQAVQDKYNNQSDNSTGFNNLGKLLGYYTNEGKNYANARSMQEQSDAAKADQLAKQYADEVKAYHLQQGQAAHDNAGFHYDPPPITKLQPGTYQPLPWAPPVAVPQGPNGLPAGTPDGTPRPRYPGIAGLMAQKKVSS